MLELNNCEVNLIDEFGESGLKILLKLSKAKRMKLSDFKNDLKMGSAAVYNAIAVLYKYGLIDESAEGPARIFFLTSKGQAVVNKLLEIENMLRQ